MDIFLFMPLFILVGAILLDLWLGDPQWLPHPVVGMGRLISYLERKWNRSDEQESRRRAKGILLAITVVGVVYLIATVLLKFLYQIHYVLGLMVEGYFICTTIAIKGLKDAALEVAKPLKEGDIKEARLKLSMIVGRDTEHLPEAEIVRGTVETVAENTVDAITAPLFFALIGGAPLALAYRAVNTLDSMVGYKNKRYLAFGWASARLDDLCNWLPARMTAFSIWLSAWMFTDARKRIKEAIFITLQDAPKHPSPNSGWTEAMVAGLLGVQLGGVNTYQGMVSERARMGKNLRKLTRDDIYQAIRFMHGGWILFLLILSIIYASYIYVTIK